MRSALFATSIGIAVILSGCSAATPPAKSVAAQSSLDSKIPLESDGTGRLDAVGVTPGSSPEAVAPGSPEEEARERYPGAVDVSVFSEVRGVEARLVVPMRYGDAATYKLTGPRGDGVIESLPLAKAAERKDGVVWWNGPIASIAYHYEDGYFVLDSLTVPAPH